MHSRHDRLCLFPYTFSVITSFFITNTLLLSIAINCCTCHVPNIMRSVPKSSNDLKTSTEALDDFDFDHNSSSSRQLWRQCVHQDGNNKATLRLSNCHLSYVHPRAFDRWPDIKVSKCQKLIDSISLLLNSHPSELNLCTIRCQLTQE